MAQRGFRGGELILLLDINLCLSLASKPTNMSTEEPQKIVEEDNASVDRSVEMAEPEEPQEW